VHLIRELDPHLSKLVLGMASRAPDGPHGSAVRLPMSLALHFVDPEANERPGKPRPHHEGPPSPGSRLHLHDRRRKRASRSPGFSPETRSEALDAFLRDRAAADAHSPHSPHGPQGEERAPFSGRAAAPAALQPLELRTAEEEQEFVSRLALQRRDVTRTTNSLLAEARARTAAHRAEVARLEQLCASGEADAHRKRADLRVVRAGVRAVSDRLSVCLRNATEQTERVGRNFLQKDVHGYGAHGAVPSELHKAGGVVPSKEQLRQRRGPSALGLGGGSAGTTTTILEENGPSESIPENKSAVGVRPKPAHAKFAGGFDVEASDPGELHSAWMALHEYAAAVVMAQRQGKYHLGWARMRLGEERRRFRECALFLKQVEEEAAFRLKRKGDAVERCDFAVEVQLEEMVLIEEIRKEGRLEKTVAGTAQAGAAGTASAGAAGTASAGAAGTPAGAAGGEEAHSGDGLREADQSADNWDALSPEDFSKVEVRPRGSSTCPPVPEEVSADNLSPQSAGGDPQSPVSEAGFGGMVIVREDD